MNRQFWFTLIGKLLFGYLSEQKKNSQVHEDEASEQKKNSQVHEDEATKKERM